MPINPSIALGVKPIEINIPDPLAGYAKGIAIQEAQNKLAADTRANETTNALNAAYRQAYDPATGNIDINRLRQQIATGGYGSALPGIEKAYAENRAKQLEQESAQYKLEQQKRLDAATHIAGLTSVNEATSQLDADVKAGKLRPDVADQIRRTLPPDDSMMPKWRQQMLVRLMSPKDQIELEKPKWLEAGGQQVPVNPLTGETPSGMKPIVKTMAPGEGARIGLEARRVALAENEAANKITPEETAVVGKAILEGRLDPNRVNSRNAKTIASTLMMKPDADLRGLSLNSATETASAKTLGNISANVVTASSEAEKMIPIVQNYVSKIQPSDYPIVNKAGLFVAKNKGDPNQAGLEASLNALVNTYARAINPRGTPTVSDKNHAREVITAAMSSGQFGEVFNVMQQEMQASQAAPKEARGKLFSSGGQSTGKSDPLGIR